MRIASLTACTAAPLLAVLPQATRAWSSAKDDVAAMINGFVQDSRKDKGLEHADALVGDGRPYHFRAG